MNTKVHYQEIRPKVGHHSSSSRRLHLPCTTSAVADAVAGPDLRGGSNVCCKSRIRRRPTGLNRSDACVDGSSRTIRCSVDRRKAGGRVVPRLSGPALWCLKEVNESVWRSSRRTKAKASTQTTCNGISSNYVASGLGLDPTCGGAPLGLRSGRCRWVSGGRRSRRRVR